MALAASAGRNRLRALLVGLPAFMLLAVGASSFYDGVGLHRLSSSFAFIHYPRFAMLVHYLCLGAAYVVWTALARVQRPWADRASPPAASWRRIVRLVLALGLALPVLLPAGRALIKKFRPI